MTQNIPAVNNTTQINSAEFVKITIFNEYPATTAANIVANSYYIINTTGTTNWYAIGANSDLPGTYFQANASGSGNGTASNVTVLTFSSSYKDETFFGNTYTAMGGLLAVGAQNRNLRATSGETTIALSGIGGNNIYNVLSTKIQGSEVVIIRGFYNNNMVLSNTYPRFKGIVTSYGITEERQGQTDNFIVSIGASSYKTVLENRIAGRKTNKESWQFFDPGDTSMNQVYAISGVTFDFGQTPKTGSVVPGNGGSPTGGAAGGLRGCPAPEMRILLSDYSTIPAGQLKVGQYVKTIHEKTKIAGDYRVEYVNIIEQPRLEIEFNDGKFICSLSHKFAYNDDWVEAQDILPGQILSNRVVKNIRQIGIGPVVHITVTDAHTYIVEGLHSHNKMAVSPSEPGP